MEIQVNKLVDVMGLLKPVIQKNPKLGITKYIEVGEGKAIATDLETMVIVDLPEAKESMLLPYSSLIDMVKYVPGNEILKIEARDKLLTLSWTDGNATYPTDSPADFPVLPEMPTRAEGMLDGDALINALEAALPYVSTEENRPILTGITLVLGNPIEVASGDGFRMSHQVLGKLSFPLEVKVIVPAHSIAVLMHVFAKTPRTPPDAADSLIQVITAKKQLHVSLTGENKLRVDFGQAASVVINLIEGSPPNWLDLVPKEEPVLQSMVFAPQLEAAVRRVQSIAKDKGANGIVRLEFKDGKVNVSSKSGETEISARLDTINTQGEPGRTAINYPYLNDFLAGKQGVITISKYTDTGPVVFQYQNSPRVLIMPMNVEWDGDKPPAAETTEPEPEAAVENPDGEETPEEAALEEQADQRDQALDSQEEAAEAEQKAEEEEPVVTE